MSSSKEDVSTVLHTDNKSDPGTARNSLREVNEKGTEEGATSNAEANGEGPEDDEMSYPSGSALILLTVGLCLCTFVVSHIFLGFKCTSADIIIIQIALDNTIIATAIPTITTVFHSLNDVGWYGSAYLLTTTSLQPFFGKIYVNFNLKYTYLFALVLFERKLTYSE